MRLKHINPTQRISSTGFLPLMRNEVPYYENLNRPAKSAYEYADLVNTYLSYGGYISVLQPGVDSLLHNFSLYEIVKITDDELVVPARPDEPNSINDKYGIVVVEADIDPVTQVRKNIVVCTFCPNFVYPDKTVDQVWGTANGIGLYVNTTPEGMYLSNAPTGPADCIGSVPIAIKIGKNSIFFSGTLRSLTTVHSNTPIE